MASPPKTLVPSKNALRALRRLALSPPAIVVGTIGSICGIATVGYETRRRVHLAEKIVERKRILQTVSTRTASVRLNDMFEAAERGEDFTLQGQHAKRRRRKGTRSFSTAATAPDAAEDADVKVDDILIRSDLEDRPLINYVFHSAPGLHTQRPDTNRSGIHSLAVERIVSASRGLHKPSTHQVYGRPSRLEKQPGGVLPSCVEKWLTTDVPASGQEVSEGPSHPHSFDSAESLVAGDEEHAGSAMDVTGYSHLEDPETDRPRPPDPTDPQSDMDIWDNDETDPNSDRSVRLFYPAPYPQSALERRLLDEEPGSNAPTRPPYQAFRPILGSVIKSYRKCAWHSVELTGQSDSVHGITGAVDYTRLSKSTPLPHQTSNLDRRAWRSRDTYNTLVGEWDARSDLRNLEKHLRNAPTPREESNLSTVFDRMEPAAHIRDFVTSSVDLQKFRQVQDFILLDWKPQQYRMKYRKWLAVLKRFGQGEHADPALAQAAFFILRFQFKPCDVYTPPVFQVIEHVLETAPTSDLAHEIFFPDLSVDYDEATSFTELPHQYISYFCDQGHDVPACIREMEKITAILASFGVKPSKQLFVPVLRAAARAGDQEQTYALMDRLESVHGWSKVPDVWFEYALWHASYGAWDEVQFTLDELHERGYTRLQSVNYAAFFHQLLLRYLTQNTALQAFGFIIHAIKYTGLHPLEMISTTIICACVRDRRYDLIAEWVRLVREAFPRVTLGLESDKRGWRLGNALLEADASSLEVAATCRAIAHGCRDDPFGPLFRDLVKEIVRLDWVERLSAISQQTSQPLSRDDFSSMTMDELLDRAYELCDSMGGPPSDLESDAGVLYREIVTQLNAVEELGSIFQGDLVAVDLGEGAPKLDTEVSETTRVVSRRARQMDRMREKLLLSMPESLTHDTLPRYDDMVAAAFQYYASCRVADHSILQYLASKLAVDRPLDALRLIEAVYMSKYVQGAERTGARPFDNDVFLTWLELVTEVGSLTSAARVLWAVVDSSRHLRWTFHFTFLVNLVGLMPVSGLHGAVVKAKYWEPDPELHHLVKRVWRIRHDSPAYLKDPFEFPAWRDWELKLRDSLQTPQALSGNDT